MTLSAVHLVLTDLDSVALALQAVELVEVVELCGVGSGCW